MQAVYTKVLSRRVYVVIALAAALLSGLFIAENRDASAIRTARETVRKSLEVERNMNTLTLAVRRVGYNHRAYLLTGSPEDLSARQQAFAEGETVISRLEQLFRRPATLAILDAITLSIDTLQQIADQSTTALRSGNDSLALALVEAPRLQQVSDRFRYSIDQIINSEAAALDANRKAVEERLRRASITRAVGRLLLALTIAFLFYNLRHLTKRQEQLIADLTAENTVRRQTESQNQALIQNLKTKNEELDHFAYIASHDLQEPLRTVTNFIGVMEEDYADELDENAKVYFGFIRSATSRMKRLISNLLYYSQIGQTAPIATIDLNEVLRTVLLDLELIIKDKQGVIKTQPLPIVSGIPIELHQLFQNLILNALKFHKADTSPVIEISCEETQALWRINIKDNGIGIAENALKKIFRMFSRVNEPGKYDGHGIGLTYCRKIVNLHGGQLSVTSTLGQGSTFTFTLSKLLTVETEA